MKKISKILLLVIGIILVITGIINFTSKDIKKNNIEKGWHVKITNDFINVRIEPDQFSKRIGEVTKGEIYKVISINTDSGYIHWYQIKIDNEKSGWIANRTKTPYLLDINNPIDIRIPIIKFFEESYSTNSYESITYDHLEVIDDKADYVVSHEVFIEHTDGIVQYWIKYRVEDKSGKYSEKIQRIIFEVEPSESQVIDFNDLLVQ